MNATGLVDDRITEAVARAAVYELCARALSFPTDAHEVALTRLRRTLDGVRIGSDETTAAIGDVIAATIQEDREDVVRCHGRLFTMIESRDCPPYETAYETRDVFRMTDVMSDVAGFYAAHGLVIGGAERERPDHVLAECEFMSFLATKEAVALEQGRDSDADECRRSAAMFLCDHLGRFASAFGVRVGVCAESPLHLAAGRLLAAWVADDVDHLDVQPAYLDRPLPPPERDDDACGSCATPCPMNLDPQP